MEFQELIHKTSLKLELLEQKEKLEAENKLLNAEVHRLRIAAHNAKAEVENLKSPSIKGFFWSIAGKKQEMLDKEQAQAHHVQQNYDLAVARQEAVAYKLRECITEIAVLGDCEGNLRKQISFPEDASLTLLTQSNILLAQIQENTSSLFTALVSISNLGAFRNGTQSTSALAGTDDKLMAAERNAQSRLTEIKGELKLLSENLAVFGIAIEIESLEQFNDDYLIDLYSYALITTRIEKVKIKLRQIGFQLDAAKPKLAQITLEHTKKHLCKLLDEAKKH